MQVLAIRSNDNIVIGFEFIAFDGTRVKVEDLARRPAVAYIAAQLTDYLRTGKMDKPRYCDLSITGRKQTWLQKSLWSIHDFIAGELPADQVTKSVALVTHGYMQANWNVGVAGLTFR